MRLLEKPRPCTQSGEAYSGDERSPGQLILRELRGTNGMKREMEKRNEDKEKDDWV